MADLSQYEVNDLANEGVVMEILDPKTGEAFPDDDGKPQWIKLLGEDSDVDKAFDRKITNRYFQQQREHGQVQLRAEETDQQNLMKLVKCTVAWNVCYDKRRPPCTEDEVKKFYQKFGWLRRKAVAFRADISNFFDNSKEGLSPTPNGMLAPSMRPIMTDPTDERT